MIHEIGRELDAYLKAHRCPVSVIDGPETHDTTTWGRERIVIEYDYEGSDSFTLPKTQGINPGLTAVRIQACKLTIYAQSKLPGAQRFEHLRRASLITDQVLTGLRYVAAIRKNNYQPKSGQYITPPDLEASELPGGAAYEFKFTFDRGVTEVNFVGEKQPEASVTAGFLKNTTNVTEPGNVSAATACGA